MVSAVRQRSTRAAAESGAAPSPVPSKRAKHSHSNEQQSRQVVEGLLNGAAAQNHDRGKGMKRHNAQVGEARAVVGVNGVGNGDVDMGGAGVEHDVVEISSDDDEEEEEDDDDDDEEETNTTRRPELRNGIASAGKVSASEQKAVRGVNDAHGQGNDDEEDEDDDGAPSFGELLARDDPIEVEAGDEPAALVPASSNQALAAAPNALTLTSVLSQALRTNDRQMLESCLLLNDLESIRKTIERLPSPLVAQLLNRLSERLHRRPGRAGNLLVWIQWALVAHGGYLAAQPDVVRRLQELNRVIKERAAALQPLMGLKGRLDMLAAQVELRRSAQAQGQAGKRTGEEDAVIYVEGEESSSSDDEDDYDDDGAGPGRALARRITGRDDVDIGGPESSGDEDVMPNGILGADEDEEEISEDEDGEGGLIDDEAEETDDDEGDEEEEESADAFDDDDDEEKVDEGSSEEESRPATRRSTALRASGFARR